MIYCIECGQQLPDNAKFCRQCGAKTSPTHEAAASNQSENSPAVADNPYCTKPLPTDGEWLDKDGITYSSDREKLIRAPRDIKEYNIPTWVTIICDEAFRECTSLTAVTIPNTVAAIGDSAFYYCTELSSINFPNSIVSIGRWAFEYCENLTSVVIPNSVTSIGSWAFDNCKQLSIKISYASMICNQIQLEYIDKVSYITNASKDDGVWIDENGVKYSADKKMLIHVPNRYSKFTIPNSVIIVCDSAISESCCLHSLVIPDSVVLLGNNCMPSSGNLNTINILPSSPIRQCLISKYGDIVFEGFVDDNGDRYTIDKKELLRAFPRDIEDYKFSERPTTIGAEAFKGYSQLKTISIPHSVTKIRESAFIRCYNLTSISTPGSITLIRSFIFDIKNTLTSIDIIGDNAIYSNGLLCSKEGGLIIALPLIIKDHIVIPSYVTSIEESAFSGCKNLTSIIIPDTVASIGCSAFNGCYNLKSIAIPASVATIKKMTFSGCRSLARVVIPDSVTTIGEKAFNDCYKLNSIDIPNSVTLIGELAFYGCRSLTSITIPDSVTSIGMHAFLNCESLTSIDTQGDNFIYENGLLYNGNKISVILSLQHIIKDNITLPSSVTVIGMYAFYGCKNLTSITIPDSVTEIGESAFSNCTSLTSITIPNSVTSIGNSDFYSCDSLTTVVIQGDNFIYENGLLYNGDKTNVILSFNHIVKSDIALPNSVTVIGKEAFRWCNNLTSITIPDSVTSIGESAFSGCNRLTSITIPNSVTSIGENAFFKYYNSLTSIIISQSSPIYAQLKKEYGDRIEPI